MHRSTARIASSVLLLALVAVALSGCMDASLAQSGSGPASISIMDAPGGRYHFGRFGRHLGLLR
jgi:hypothetical protein